MFESNYEFVLACAMVLTSSLISKPYSHQLLARRWVITDLLRSTSLHPNRNNYIGKTLLNCGIIFISSYVRARICTVQQVCYMKKGTLSPDPFV